jgi:hypothetical protein
MHKRIAAIPIVALLVLLLQCCATARPAPRPSPDAQELAKLKASVMSADYRADFAELARLRDELAKWPKERELSYLARYWSGFASWRIAINGANHSMKMDDLEMNLRNAAADFYTSLRLRNDFADAYAAASLVNAWLATFDRDELPERLSLSQWLFARAKALDADNPRVLWAEGAFHFYTPPEQGGSRAKAIETYRRMVEQAERRGADPASPFPDWGKAEGLMSLSFAHFTLTPPDAHTAREEALAALQAVPEWSYVRDWLLPRIEHLIAAEP